MGCSSLFDQWLESRFHLCFAPDATYRFFSLPIVRWLARRPYYRHSISRQ